MKEQIIIYLHPTDYKQLIYIFSNQDEDAPIVTESTIDNLATTLNYVIEQYDITLVQLAGPVDYTSKILDDLQHSVSIHFGHTKSIDISLFK